MTTEILEKTQQEVKSTNDIPNPLTDPDKWTEYVLSLFQDHEIDNKHPKVDGLRRVARLLLGAFNSRTMVVKAPSSGDLSATVIVELEFTQNGMNSVFSGAADVNRFNTDEEFAIYSVATAETRAEGRALRKSLFLSKIICSEEVSKNPTSLPPPLLDNNDKLKATEALISGVRTMCQSVKVDPIKLAIVTGKMDISKLEDLTINDVHKMVERINIYRNDINAIPDSVKA